MRRPRAEKVIVSLVSADGNQECFSRCLPTITVRDLKAKWRQQHGPRQGDILIRTAEGAFPTDDLLLNSFQDCSNPSQVIELTVLGGQGVLIVCGRESKQLPANAVSKSPRQLIGRIRGLFGFPMTQSFRLRADGASLHMERSLMDQGVGPGSRIELDVSRTLEVVDMWHGSQAIILRVFDSQTLLEVLPESWRQPGAQLEIRLAGSSRKIDLNTLARDVPGQSGPVCLRVDRSEQIPLLVRHLVTRSVLWPDDTPAEVIPGPMKEVACGKQSDNLVPCAQPFGQLARRRFFGHAFFHTDPLRLMFRQGEKRKARFKVVRLPRDSLAEDLRQTVIASGRESARSEQIVDGEGKGLENSADGPLTALPDGAHVQLKARPPQHCIRVTTGGRKLMWTEQRSVINFSELAGQIAMLTKTSPLEVLRRVFRCAGCGRRMCEEEEEYQMIPAACCRVKSLVLLEVKEKSLQTRNPRYSEKCCGTEESDALLEKDVAFTVEEATPTAEASFMTLPAKAEPLPRQTSLSSSAGSRLLETIVHRDRTLPSPPSTLPRTITPASFDDDTSVEVLLHLPMRDRPFSERLKKNLPLTRVIEDLHKDRAFFPVNDIIVNGRQLNTGPNWRKQTVAECRIRSRDSVVVEPGRPDSVTVLTMHVDGFHDRENIPLDIDEWSWGSLWARICHFFATDGRMPVVFISMTFVDRLGKPQQRGVRGGNLLHGIVANYDEETGMEVHDESSRDVAATFANEFLCAQSGFRAPPQCSPILHIHPNCDVMCLPRCDAPITEAVEAPDDALFQPDSAVLVWGLRARQGRSERWQLYLEHGDGSICNVEHGNTFEDASLLPGTGSDVHRAILLLRNGDHIPHCRVSPNTPVKVWQRNGAKSTIEGRRIHMQRIERQFDALWILTRSVGHFQRRFSEVMAIR